MPHSSHRPHCHCCCCHAERWPIIRCSCTSVVLPPTRSWRPIRAVYWRLIWHHVYCCRPSWCGSCCCCCVYSCCSAVCLAWIAPTATEEEEGQGEGERKGRRWWRRGFCLWNNACAPASQVQNGKQAVHLVSTGFYARYLVYLPSDIAFTYTTLSVTGIQFHAMAGSFSSMTFPPLYYLPTHFSSSCPPPLSVHVVPVDRFPSTSFRRIIRQQLRPSLPITLPLEPRSPTPNRASSSNHSSSTSSTNSSSSSSSSNSSSCLGSRWGVWVVQEGASVGRRAAG